jgi:hypothetical protein
MQYHTHNQFAAFVDLEDGRYLKDPVSYTTGSSLAINLIGVNDSNGRKKGTVTVKLVDQNSEVVFSKPILMEIDPFWQSVVPVNIELPEQPGGYMVLSELNDGNADVPFQVSRRYIIIGDTDDPEFPEYTYEFPPEWPK